MADDDAARGDVTPRKAPPKSAPPPGEGTRKKKAPPPPSGAPPKSAAAALRAKTGPPSSPPPKAVSASIQKIRAEAKGGEAAQTKPKKRVPPPSSPAPTAPPTGNDSVDEKDQANSATFSGNPPPAKVPSTAPPKPKKKPPAQDVLGDPMTAAPSSSGDAKGDQPTSGGAPVMVEKRSHVQHIVASEMKPIMDTRSKPRKTVTELLQEDTAFKKVTSPALSSTEDASMLVSKNNTSMYSSVSSHTSGKAAPQSMTMRREHVEEELTVRKAIVMKKKDDLAKAVLHDDDDDDDDSIDEIEDIPILDTTMMTAAPKDRADDDDDPEIVMEKAPCDEKPDDRHILDNSGNAPITTSKAALTDALYQEMKQLETLGQATAPSPSVEDNDDDMDDMDDMDDGDAKPHRHHVEAAAGSIDDVKLPDGEPKKRSKKPKQHAEDKKKAFELFNPKRVPYVPNQLLEFVVNPLEVGRGHVVRCFIERNRSGQNKLSPLYTMLIEINSSKGRPILYARKKPTSRISSHFIFSLNKEDLFLSRSLRSKQFVGKLRSDTRKMEYTLFDQGDNPEDIDSDCEIDEEVRQHIRAQMAVIRYHPMKKEFPRKMEVILPAIVEHETADEPIKSYLDWRPISRDQSFEALFTEVAEQGGQNVLERDKFICMHKRESQYDPLSSCIVDFRSRATSVSVKNFQLVHSQPTDQDKYRQAYIQAHPTYHYDDESTVSVPQEHIMLQMGRVGTNCFNMDFQYPLSMLQAFAICISRFDSKQK